MGKASHQKLDIALQKANGNVGLAVKYAIAPHLVEHVGLGCSAKFLYFLNSTSSEHFDLAGDLPRIKDFGLDERQFRRASAWYHWSARLGAFLGLLLCTAMVMIVVAYSEQESTLNTLALALFLPGSYLLAIILAKVVRWVYVTRSSLVKACLLFCRALQGFGRTTKEFWNDLTWREFQQEVAVLFTQSGYRSYAKLSSNDKGVDVVAVDDHGIIAIQCKKYKKAVGPAPVRELLGSLQSERARLGVLIAAAGFSDKAYEYASDKPIVLMDLDDLLSLKGFKLKEYLSK